MSLNIYKCHMRVIICILRAWCSWLSRQRRTCSRRPSSCARASWPARHRRLKRSATLPFWSLSGIQRKSGIKHTDLRFACVCVANANANEATSDAALLGEFVVELVVCEHALVEVVDVQVDHSVHVFAAILVPVRTVESFISTTTTTTIDSNDIATCAVGV